MHIVHSNYNLTAAVNDNYTDRSFYVIELGCSLPPGGLKCENIISDDFVIHFVTSGRGLYNNQNIDASCGFMIAPLEPYTFEFDALDPWRHYWIRLNGSMCVATLKRCGFEPHNHVFECGWFERFLPEFDEVIFGQETQIDYSLYMLGIFYRVAAHHIGKVDTPNIDSRRLYLNLAMQYIDANYFLRITVEDIAREVNVSSKYLYKIFVSQLGVSPSEYIISYRLNKARILLETTTLPISGVARSVGYSEPNYFTLSFGRAFGQSPTEYRSKNKKSSE